jgi:hypothetical protein
MYNMQITQINTTRKGKQMGTGQVIKAYIRQLQGEARELALAARDRTVPAKALFASAAFLGLFKLAVGIYCTLVSIAAMTHVTTIRIP